MMGSFGGGGWAMFFLLIHSAPSPSPSTAPKGMQTVSGDHGSHDSIRTVGRDMPRQANTDEIRAVQSMLLVISSTLVELVIFFVPYDYIIAI